VLGAAAAFGFHPHWLRFGQAAAILALIVATYFGIGMIAGALIIAYRRTGQLQQAVIVGSAMLGGVMYPTKLVTEAVPHWVSRLSDVVPMTYGIRAVRRITIDDWPLRAVLADVGILSIFCLAFLTLGSLGMTHALRRARAEGTLSQY
jgi:ABC-2 type transport system permease protein